MVWGTDFLKIFINARQRSTLKTCAHLKATLYSDNVQSEFYITVSWIPTLKMRSYSREAAPYFDSARSFSRSKQRCTSTTRIYPIVEQRRTSTTRAILITEKQRSTSTTCILLIVEVRRTLTARAILITVKQRCTSTMCILRVEWEMDKYRGKANLVCWYLLVFQQRVRLY